MHGNVAQGTRAAEWRGGWPVVLAGFVGVGVSQLHIVSLGFMIAPIESEFGWNRSQITAATLIFSVLTALVAPFAGRLIDRASERAVGLPAIAAYCALLALLSQAGPSIWTWWAIWFGIGIVSPFMALLLWTTVVGRRFDRQRGLALALTLCGTSLATASMPFLTFRLIGSYGWHGAYLALGGVSALVLLPLALAVLHRQPEDRSGVPQAARAKMPWSEALRSPLFLRIAFAGGVVAMVSTTTSIHFVPLLQQRGFSPATAAVGAGLVGIGAIIGRVATGALLDRSRGPLIGAFAFAMPILPSLMLLVLEPDPAVAIAAGFLIGLSFGAETDVISYFTARYFGMARYGAVFGTISATLVLFAGLGPWVASLSYDATGSYSAVLLAIVPLSALAAYAAGSLGPYPPRE